MDAALSDEIFDDECVRLAVAHGVYMHTKWGTWHLGHSHDPLRFSCGRHLEVCGLLRYQRMGAFPDASTAWCMTCKEAIGRLGRAALATDVAVQLGGTAEDEVSDAL